MKRSILKFKLEYLFLLLSVLIVVTSFAIDLCTTSSTFFARSGSLMVLFAVIVEYRISGFIYDDIQKAMLLNSKIDVPIPLKAKPRKDKIFLSRITHGLAIVGTLIWGYGDLLFAKG